VDEQRPPEPTATERERLDFEETRANHRRRWSRPCGAFEGQNLVEFALVSVTFLLIVFGTVDLGRVIFIKSQLENGVKEAAREQKTQVAAGYNCTSVTPTWRVRYQKNPEEGGGCMQGEHPRPGMSTATATMSCSPSCTAGATLTVNGQIQFQAITQEFLGISPITLTASATVIIE
jgi:hypothetical protein